MRDETKGRNLRPGQLRRCDAPLLRTAWLFALLLVAAGAPPAAATGLYTQNVTLSPGWNAVHILVTPQDGTPESIFAGLPLESVWTFASNATAAEFLLDPAELEWNRAGWLGYRTAPEESLLNNLFRIVGNRVYLIEIGGTTPINWSITGVPVAAPTRWVADSWNLVGLPVDPAVTVTLGALLTHSPAHAGQPIWEFDRTTQTWTQLVNPATRQVREGDAFWIYTDGPSFYQGPWELDLVNTAGIDFGRTNSDRRVRLTNRSSVARTVTIDQLGGQLPLTIKRFDPSSGRFRWEPLASMSNWSVPANGTVSLALAIQRQDLAAAQEATVLRWTDGQGTRRLIAVRAGR